MSLVTPETVEKLRKALHVKAKEEVEFDVARRTGGGGDPLSSAPLVVAPVTQDGRAGDAPHPRRVLGLATGAGEPVGEDGRPSVCEGMILERAGCGKSARPVRRAAAGNGVGINRMMPAHHRASRRLYPRAAMIAQDFARLRVLATGIIATPMVEGACARKRAKDQRGRGQRSLCRAEPPKSEGT